ncbi:hypothetical protein [Ochrobactrum sp. S1502_03]|uniref:hypothetical protein n=1 Tax=Ochrobactrum sp. S1502_03 TaxID=3108451 RepID=UPI0037C8B4F7
MGNRTTVTQQRVQAREALTDWHKKVKPIVPKCGAKTRAGGTCQEVGMANGRCWRHGGKTGKGVNWHKPIWPSGSSDAEKKLCRKLSERAKEAKARQARLDAMTPDEYERYQKWQKSHTPGDPKVRAAFRETKRKSDEIRKILSKERPVSPEAEEIQSAIDALQKRIAQTETDIFG